jgi:hypothetical protein
VSIDIDCNKVDKLIPSVDLTFDDYKEASHQQEDNDEIQFIESFTVQTSKTYSFEEEELVPVENLKKKGKFTLDDSNILPDIDFGTSNKNKQIK